MITQQCVVCCKLSANRIAGDDNPHALVRLALRPLDDPEPPAASRSLCDQGGRLISGRKSSSGTTKPHRTLS
ncbi:hypothetical protein GCM10017668_34090 [Streptomyces tuirus]|uniref:Uncharacterized protein n=1 Tax=Streptomyces tuirus TaxID=68278 RepID=A0A7G1NIU8_9ACTN|nr:hypothetical protein GCM10017668_34090 [Streptomyces tuirus]